MESVRPGNRILTIPGTRTEFNWRPVAGAEYYVFRIYTAANRINPVYDQAVVNITRHSVLMDSFANGTYYWTIQAIPRGEIGTEQFTLRRLQPVTLDSPAQGTVLSGLTALRQQTVFQWSSTESIGRSRFVLSRNPNPLQGPAAIERISPGRTISLDRLNEGIWYWTVEAQSPEGLNISAVSPRQLQVLPIPILPEPQNRLPATGRRFEADDLRAQRTITFSWSAVNGANAYILSLYHETAAGRRQLVRTNPENRTSWTLENLSILDQGTFIWQVEAVNSNQSGTIEQRGRIGENTFIVDVPLPGPVQKRDMGRLYGSY